MDCAGIQNLLSEYIDEVLDARTTAIVEKHIAQCERCRSELRSMQAMIRELQSISPVRAPARFSVELNERLEKSDSLFRKAKRIFFQPMFLKVPLEIATVAVVVVLVYSVWIEQGADNYLKPKSLRSPHPVLEYRLEENELTADRAFEKFSMEDAMHARDGEKQKGKRIGEIELTLTLKPARDRGIDYALSERAPAPAAPSQRALAPMEQPKAGRASRPKLALRALKAKKPESIESRERKEEETDEDRFASDRTADRAPSTATRDTIVSELEKLAKTYQGTVLSVQPGSGAGQGGIVIVELPAENYLSFTNDLKNMAPLKGDFQKFPDSEYEKVRITVKLSSHK